ncbi:UNVERIFIED_CONTAM: hypothetical protein GTU68_059116 [Idotea baltica]|nr:hypothetical protein [Idotea baltica]
MPTAPFSRPNAARAPMCARLPAISAAVLAHVHTSPSCAACWWGPSVRTILWAWTNSWKLPKAWKRSSCRCARRWTI